MTPSETATVLAVASGIDNRSITPEVATIWAQSLDGDVTPDDAIKAVVAHYAESTEWVKPAHINTIVRGWRRTQVRDLPPVVPPRELADLPDQEARWNRVWGDAVLAGHTDAAARGIANRQFNIDEDAAPLELESLRGSLRDQLERGEREMADRKRFAEIQAEVERQAKAKKRAEQEAAEQSRLPVVDATEHTKDVA